MIKLETAMEISRRAFEEGNARGVVNMCVAVTDVGGNIRLVHRADGQGIFGPDTALGKARAALGFNRTSLALSKTFTDPCAVAALNGATGGRFLPLGGGVVVTDADSNIVGAAAVSGGMPDVDEDIIAAAIESVGLKVLR